MEGINWGDLFSAMDRFLVALAGQHGLWVYFTLFCIYFSETGLVFMAFLPGDSLLFVAGAVAASGAMNILSGQRMDPRYLAARRPVCYAEQEPRRWSERPGRKRSPTTSA